MTESNWISLEMRGIKWKKKDNSNLINKLEDKKLILNFFFVF